MGLVVSIVSHGHAVQVRSLLSLLSRPGATPLLRVWLTLNLPEPELLSLAEQTWPFDLHILENDTSQGFSTNHNQAFAHELSKPDPASQFCVLNPDMSWQVDPFPALLSALEVPQAGCAFPLQLDNRGQEQDHRRTIPSPLALLQRHLLNSTPAPEMQPEWVNAAFLVFPCHVYAALGGFDTRYFMYCEDVDICLRLQLAGYTLVEAATARVVHDARRASRRDLRHLMWHVRSLLMLWTSPAYRRFRSFQPTFSIRC